MLVGSGSIRLKALGPLVTLRDLLSCFPFDDTLTRYTVTGAQLQRIFQHIMRVENRNAEGECYQVNGKVGAQYDDATHTLTALTIDGDPVVNTEQYTVGLQGYHFNNASRYLNITHDDLLASGDTKVIATSAREVLEEYLRNHQNIKRKIEGRLRYHS
jgi:5'-nucleotidase/UDP-sugar diphosphatase